MPALIKATAEQVERKEEEDWRRGPHMALPGNTEGSPLSLWPARMVRNAGESYASDLMLTRSEIWTARERRPPERGHEN